ncbi:hypothetical protein FF1_046643 [Malus domestica]
MVNLGEGVEDSQLRVVRQVINKVELKAEARGQSKWRWRLARNSRKATMIHLIWNCRGLGSDTWIEETLRPTDAPWICARDFNEILSADKKSGGRHWHRTGTPILQSFLNNIELLDLGFVGPKFTWRATRNGDLVQERLDRGLINGNWQVRWPNSVIIHENVRASDHCPLVLMTEPKAPKCKLLFRFEAFWCKEEGCRETIARCWNVENVGGRMEAWKAKIQTTKCGLIRLSTDKFKARKFELQRLNSHLGSLQQNWEANGTEIDEVTTMINRLEAQEEEYWASRSRIQWLQAGDSNTAFFHQSTVQRRRRNKLARIRNEEGNWQIGPNGVRMTVEYHFKRLFQSDSNRDWGDIMGCLEPVVTRDMNEISCGPISEDEIKEAVFNMGGSKTPGPDGFQGLFIQSYWDIIAADVK